MSILIRNDEFLSASAAATFFRGFDFLQRIPALLREEIFLVHEFNPIFLGKRFRAFAIHHHVSGFFHHQSREAYRIPYVLQTGNSACAEGFAVHNGRVHLVRANTGKHCAFGCIKMRIVLEHTYGGFGSIEARPTALQDFVTRRQRVLQAVTIFALSLRGHLAALNSSSAAVHQESELSYFHVWLIVCLSFAHSLGRT